MFHAPDRHVEFVREEEKNSKAESSPADDFHGTEGVLKIGVHQIPCDNDRKRGKNKFPYQPELRIQAPTGRDLFKAPEHGPRHGSNILIEI